MVSLHGVMVSLHGVMVSLHGFPKLFKHRQELETLKA
jgi:hypothetical protein